MQGHIHVGMKINPIKIKWDIQRKIVHHPLFMCKTFRHEVFSNYSFWVRTLLGKITFLLINITCILFHNSKIIILF